MYSAVNHTGLIREGKYNKKNIKKHSEAKVKHSSAELGCCDGVVDDDDDVMMLAFR